MNIIQKDYVEKTLAFIELGDKKVHSFDALLMAMTIPAVKVVDGKCQCLFGFWAEVIERNKRN